MNPDDFGFPARSGERIFEVVQRYEIFISAVGCYLAFDRYRRFRYGYT